MVNITVSGNVLFFAAKSYRCAVGKSGFSDHKKEGDGCTPLGTVYLRECWYRADRLSAPETGLPLRVIQENDGWCDDPASKEYNRPVTLPYAFSYENLWRSEHVYDLIVALGYNDDPVIPGLGSAIFLHVAKPDYSPTEGCVALALPDLLDVLKLCDSGTVIEIRQS